MKEEPSIEKMAEVIEAFGWDYAESSDGTGDMFVYWDHTQGDMPKWCGDNMTSCECLEDIYRLFMESKEELALRATELFGNPDDPPPTNFVELQYFIPDPIDINWDNAMKLRDATPKRYFDYKLLDVVHARMQDSILTFTDAYYHATPADYILAACKAKEKSNEPE